MTLICLEIDPIAAQDKEFVWHDPAKIVVAETCGECHQSEYQVWKKTKHATGFKTLHRTEVAERIKKSMGYKLIKRESLCIKCHYLGGYKKDQLRALSGVSCESCHGAAKDWIDVHNNYGPGFTYETESQQHKSQRIQQSIGKGMFRPSELYEVLASCFQCHTVPHEKLVNVGGHSSGYRDFQLLARLDSIRHNFLQAQFDPSRIENAETTPERKRIIYVVGSALDLEFGLRGAAIAKEQGSYIRSIQRRVQNATDLIRAIGSKISNPEIEKIIQIAAAVEIKPENNAVLLSESEKIKKLTKEFIRKNDGSQLASLDGYISGAEEPVPPPQPVAIESVATKEKATITEPVYPKKSYIRPRSKYKTIGPTCTQCHSAQNTWWQKDKHFSSIDPFANRLQKNIQIARAYGLDASEITKGNSLCMDCHGTVISGEESQDVFDGVSCESCHGPAGDYKKPHSVDKPPNGYNVGKEFGMVLLEDLEARTEACAQCHYITDPRLLSTGHPSGANFNIVAGDQKIKHWQENTLAAAALERAYTKAKQKMGPIPEVTLVSFAQPQVRAQSIADQPKKDSYSPKRAIGSRVVPIELPPFPVISDSASVAEVLLIIKRRLELLYQKTGKQK